MAADLIAGRSGTRLHPYRDYRGVPVIGSWHWDHELGLGIVTEMDADEAFQSLYHTEWWLYGPWGPRTRTAASNETRGEFAPIEALTVDRVFQAVLDLHDAFIDGQRPLKP